MSVIRSYQNQLSGDSCQTHVDVDMKPVEINSKTAHNECMSEFRKNKNSLSNILDIETVCR
jgi:hypothetical protein